MQLVAELQAKQLLNVFEHNSHKLFPEFAHVTFYFFLNFYILI